MPPKKTKSAKLPKQKVQTAVTPVTRAVGGKRKRVEACEPARGRRGKPAKKAKLEEIMYFRLLDVPEDVLYEVRATQSCFPTTLTITALRFALICIPSLFYVSRVRAKGCVKFS